MSLLPPQFHDPVYLPLGEPLREKPRKKIESLTRVRPGIYRDSQGRLQTSFPENERAKYFHGDPRKLHRALEDIEDKLKEMLLRRIVIDFPSFPD